MKLIKKTFFLAVLLAFSACAASKTSQERISEVTSKIQKKDYAVVANYAQPFQGKQLYLTEDYDLVIKGDSAFAYLPYFGQAKLAPLNPAEGGIKFAEKIIDYQSVMNKKGDGWDITFKVNAREFRYEFSLNIFNDGTSRFTVNSFQRDPISFSGYMKDLAAQKENKK